MKYHVQLLTTASHTVTVEADSPEDARDMASDLGVGSLCHHCAGKIDLGDFEVDESEHGVWPADA